MVRNGNKQYEDEPDPVFLGMGSYSGPTGGSMRPKKKEQIGFIRSTKKKGKPLQPKRPAPKRKR